MIHEKYFELKKEQEKLLGRKNEVDVNFYNGIYDRYRYPVLTREHAPIEWQYDLDAQTNPFFEERLGINAVMNSGALYMNGKYYLVARIEGNDRKSFFGVAESDNGVDGFRFWDYPVVLPDTCPGETNVYDMRLTKHEDGYIYGVFCSESKDKNAKDLSAAVAAAGIVRTKDLKTWERIWLRCILPSRGTWCFTPSSWTASTPSIQDPWMTSSTRDPAAVSVSDSARISPTQ